MKLLPQLCSLAVAVTAALISLGTPVIAQEKPSPLADVIQKRQVILEAHGNGRDQLTLTLKNASGAPLSVTVPAGLIASGREPDSRVIVSRAATATMATGSSTIDVSLPVVALSSRNTIKTQACTLDLAASEPRLAALLKALDDQPDAPRATVQLAVFGILEDMDFAQWRKYQGAAVDAQPTPADITQAIDALGLLRATAPQQKFALGKDPELRLRALRNPWSRTKAAVLYGLDLGDDVAVPDLQQLLHTQPGDNCPICRQRALMQKPAEIP